MIRPYVTAEEAVELLNAAWAMDPEAVEALLNNRVPCDLLLANHPTIQVQELPGNKFVVGFLGLLNGMFGVNDENNLGPIRAKFDEAGRLCGFFAAP